MTATTTTTTDTAPTAEADTATDAYRVGMARLGERPDLLAACERAADRAAKRAADAGDINAETCAGTLDRVARYVGAHGMPAETDRVAALISTAAKRAAASARDRARGAWAPRIRTTAPTTAPNALEGWETAKLIRHAEQYTAGKLTTRVQAQAVLDARAESSLPMVTRRALLTTTAGDGTLTTTTATVGAYLMASRVNGGTVPSAEATYWRGRTAWDTAAALTDAVGAPMVDSLTDAYRGKRLRQNRRGGAVGDTLRNRRVAWSRVADGGDRGNTRRGVVRDASRVGAVVAMGAHREARSMVAAAKLADAYTAPTVGAVVTYSFPADAPTRRRPMPWDAMPGQSGVVSRANPPRLESWQHAAPMASHAEAWRGKLTDAAGWCERGHHAWQSIAVPFLL
jgi:hypothetical protein